MFMEPSDYLHEKSTSLGQWSSFPSNIEGWRSVVFEDDGRSTRLRELAEKIFYKKTIDVEFIELRHGMLEMIRYDDEAELIDNLTGVNVPDFRIISIAQDHSLTQLDITHQCMLKIMTALKISPDFLSVLLKFGKQPQVFEEGSTVISVSEPLRHCFDICYQFTYMQKNGRNLPDDPWSLRQSGVYQRILKTAGGFDSANIILHPTPLDASEVQKRLRRLRFSQERIKLMVSDPMSIHFAVLASYVHNWQAYLEVLVDEFRHLRGRIAEIDIDSKHDYDLQTSSLRKLKEIEDRLLFRVTANVSSNIAIVEALGKASKRLHEMGTIDHERLSDNAICLESFLSRLLSHKSSAETLEKRLSATISFLSNLLDLKNQKTAALINDNMLALTRETVDDNATIFIISLVTLIYLPSQWIATLLGMNFFEYDVTTGNYRASRSVWIYFAVAVPLTTLTVIAWRILAKQQRTQRKRHRQRIEDG